MIGLLLVLGLVFLAAWGLTGCLRAYALRGERLLDVPNNRSSHTDPTPRGGGVAIVLAALGGMLWGVMAGRISLEEGAALGGAGLAVAAIGFLDDHGHVAARWRLGVHFLAAGWLMAWLGGPPSLGGWSASWGWLLGLPALVWLLNLTNFMDGIDGLAGGEAVFAGLAGAALLAAAGLPERADASLIVAAAATGFLVWNAPPARIFMGDAGSGFLGLLLGGLALQAAHLDGRLLWAWVILLGVFVADASFTLLRRLLRGERVYEAHRSHAYQWAARQHGHRTVTLAAMTINLFWLFPWALAVALGAFSPLPAILVAYLPLVALVWRLGAGRAES
ncbi:MAG: glycosyl transferase [Zoogloeaceae bacterium]|nr:glycosyl transferase [Zoogloeaceae bacterium]